MKAKFALPVLIVAALALSACGPTTINQAAPDAVRSLSVSGVGQVKLTPDVAYIYIGVHTEGSGAAEAVADNNAQTQALVDALKAAGVEEKDISTSNFSIWPNTQYGPAGERLGTTYVVDNSVYVAVRDLDALGDLLESAIAVGANSINSIQFDVADKTAAMKEARDLAVADAKTKAEELAATSGVSLAEIQNVSYFDSGAVPYFDGRGGGGGAEGAIASAVPIQPGQLTITASVNITYYIK
jgi:hypothetical protein